MLSQRHGLPLVASGDVHWHVRSRKPLQDTLTAIRLGQPLSECGLALQPNAEQHLRQRLRLAQILSAACLQQTQAIAKLWGHFRRRNCATNIPEEIVPVGESMSAYLRRLTYEGAVTRLNNT